MVDNHTRADESGPVTLAERLEWLFDKIRPVEAELDDPAEIGRKYHNKEIANKINEVTEGDLADVTISGAYIGEIRRGKTTDPRLSHLKALASAFGVDTAFFVDNGVAAKVQAEIDLLLKLRTMRVQQVALRQVLTQQGLSDESTALVEQLVAQLAAHHEQTRDPQPPNQRQSATGGPATNSNG